MLNTVQGEDVLEVMVLSSSRAHASNAEHEISEDASRVGIEQVRRYKA